MTGKSKSLWPVVITDGTLVLRPLRFRDRGVWLASRRFNREWLQPWEATAPINKIDSALPSYFEMVLHHNREGRAERALSLAIWSDAEFIGQITLGGIAFGAYRGGHIGYWIDQRSANKGLTTRAVKALTKYGFDEMQLHRIEINLRPENGASRKVAEKAGYKLEGNRANFLHIDGDWRDHITFVAENPRI
jgi:ribosomal-protein-alanine N-acetyltransferase